jgi:hypothetical protein
MSPDGLPTDPEQRARVLALFALLLPLGGVTHDGAAVDAAEVLLRALPPAQHPVEAHARGEALAVLAAEAEAAQAPRGDKVRKALQPRLRVAQLILACTAPVDRLADVLRRTA